jgi:hypothetical protein
MKRKLAAVAAGPAAADDFDGDDLLFFGYPAYNVVDDVEFQNVRERNPRDGECFVDDVDLDGFVAEYELVCYG